MTLSTVVWRGRRWGVMLSQRRGIRITLSNNYPSYCYLASLDKPGHHVSQLLCPHRNPLASPSILPSPVPQPHSLLCSRPYAVASPLSLPQGRSRQNILLSPLLWTPSASTPSPPPFLGVSPQSLKTDFTRNPSVHT